MLETVITFFQSALGLKAKQGWIFTAFGGAIWLLHYLAIDPFGADLDKTWLVVAAMCCLLGICILLISFGEYLFGKAKDEMSRRAERNADNDKRSQRAANAVKNLGVLDDFELRCLMWIMRHREQRFSATYNIRRYSKLVQKGIIYPDNDDDTDIYVVDDSVWGKMEELRKANANMQLNPKKAPWDDQGW